MRNGHNIVAAAMSIFIFIWRAVFIFDQIFAIVFAFETPKSVFEFDKTYLTPALLHVAQACWL